MSFVKYTKNELPEPNKGVIINPYFGGKILAIFKDNHFYGCSYDVVLHKSAVEAWFYVDSDTKENPELPKSKSKEGREKYIVNVMEFMSKPGY